MTLNNAYQISQAFGIYSLKSQFPLFGHTFLYLVSSKIYKGAVTHALELPIPTQAVLDLIPTFVGSNRNVKTVNYYTSIPLALGLKAPSLTLVSTLHLLKKNKACIPPSFLAKANQGTVQYAFDCPKELRLLSIAPKKNKRVVFLSTMHFKEEKDEETGKEEINAFYKS